ncbi:MAG: DNA mismatch repair endonuclease MutL [Pyrinomonadaceae bacterium]|nr:DNA mismatch repair endonuclease MutL [Pyrinomonadaceae bacterium]
MNKIKILPDNLANQIAAGEVVERPASVVKELVENALDAGAKRLQIDIELGGRRLIKISDDGTGMVRDDAILAFERHATSKIKTLEDLAKIATLGFRGEALASIASVAKVELITKTLDSEAATRVIIEGGRLIDVKDAPRSNGTTLTVRDLFFNTPARRKFMRSEATENYHLTNIVQHYALANPAIAFTLTNNGREVLRLSPAKDLRERAYQIFGSQMVESLLKVEGGREFVAKVTGFISAPRERRTTRDGQYFFINGRFVKDRIIAGGLLEGFRAVLPHGVYPVAFLFLEIPFEELDVNVHPSKTEVRFRRSEAVKETIAEAIRGALASAGIVAIQGSGVRGQESGQTALTNDFPRTNSSDFNQFEKTQNPVYEQPKIEFQISDFKSPNENAAENSVFPNENIESGSVTNQPTETEVFSNDFEQTAQVKNQNSEFRIQNSESENQTFNQSDWAIQNPKSKIQNLETPIVDSAAKIPKSIEPETLSSSRIRPLSQLHDSFIIAVDDEGLLLIDQHVAHERILFDKFRSKETTRKIESQNLLLPETIDLSPAQAAAFDIVETELENLGFALMKLSGRTIAVKAVPTDLPASEVRNLLAEILDTVDKEKFGAARANLHDQIAASLACKAAVKINMKLTLEKMQWLIDKLLTTSSPTTCPHGRPVILRLTMKDIERGFHRT